MLHKFNVKISDDITILAYQRTMELVSPENTEIDILDDFVSLLICYSQVTFVIAQNAICTGELKNIKDPQLDSITPIGFLVSYKNKEDEKTDLIPFNSIHRYSFFDKRELTEKDWEEMINRTQPVLN